MTRQLIILTGPVQTGKTSLLMHWSSSRNDVAGILTPVIDGERYFYDMISKTQFKMNLPAGRQGAEEDEEEKFEVGRFIFSAQNFRKASDIISAAAKTGDHRYLIIDEIGPLELKQQKGFYEVLMEILKMEKEIPRPILVVRENCLDEIKNRAGSFGWELKIFTRDEFMPG